MRRSLASVHGPSMPLAAFAQVVSCQVICASSQAVNKAERASAHAKSSEIREDTRQR